MRAVTLGLFCCGLSACATSGGFQSYVVPMLSPEAASQAAYDITAFVGQQITPAAGPIAVLQAPGDTALWPKLTDDLRAAGYTVADDHGRHHLRFAVAKLPDGTFLRVTLDQTSMAQLYRSDPAGGIEPSGPATILTAASE